MSDPRLGHAHHLLTLGRYPEAEKALGAYLVDEPEDVLALAWMGLALAEQKRFDEASEHVGRAVQLEPGFAYAWFVMAHVRFDRGRLDEARDAVAEAIRLDPEHADSFALLASIHARRKRWQDALEAADAGLRVEPDNDSCTNVRALALRGLGRLEEAAHALEGQLSRTPEDARTHANRGWTLLHQGEHQGALHHFREALRLDPASEWARQGVIESLKARHWFYRPALRYFLWMSRLTGRAQVFILLGGYLLYRLALNLASRELLIAPVLWGVVIAYVAFVATSWFASPLANALLYFHPLGRLALTRRERVEAWSITGLLLTGAAIATLGWIADSPWFVVGIALSILCLPLKLTFELEQPRSRLVMWAFTGVMAMVGAWWSVAAHESAVSGSELERVATRAVELQAEARRLDGTVGAAGPEGEAAELRREREELAARQAAFEAEFPEPEIRRRIDARQSARATANGIGLAYAILGFWISQLVAAKLASSSERR
jgi:tetratricopeptide (TPR) repeat protein